jgi:hypothetical protein
VGGDVWSPDGRAIYYIQLSDLPAGASPTDYYRGVRVLRHRLGEQVGPGVPVLSAAAVGEDDRLFPFLDIDGSSGVAFGILNTGVGPHSAYYVAPAGDLATGTPAWRPLFALADSVLAVAAHGVDLYVLTQKGAPLGRIVRTALDSPDLAAAETVLAETDQRLRWISAALDALYVDVFAAGTNRLTRIPWGGAPIPVALPPGTSVSQTYDDPFRSQLRADPTAGWCSPGASRAGRPSAARIATTHPRPLWRSCRCARRAATTASSDTRWRPSSLPATTASSSRSRSSVPIPWPGRARSRSCWTHTAHTGSSMPPASSPSGSPGSSRAAPAPPVTSAAGGTMARRGTVPGRGRPNRTRGSTSSPAPSSSSARATPRPERVVAVGGQRGRDHRRARHHRAARPIRGRHHSERRARCRSVRDDTGRPGQHPRVRFGRDRGGIPGAAGP